MTDVLFSVRDDEDFDVIGKYVLILFVTSFKELFVGNFLEMPEQINWRFKSFQVKLYLSFKSGTPFYCR